MINFFKSTTKPYLQKYKLQEMSHIILNFEMQGHVSPRPYACLYCRQTVHVHSVPLQTSCACAQCPAADMTHAMMFEEPAQSCYLQLCVMVRTNCQNLILKVKLYGCLVCPSCTFPDLVSNIILICRHNQESFCEVSILPTCGPQSHSKGPKNPRTNATIHIACGTRHNDETSSPFNQTSSL